MVVNKKCKRRVNFCFAKVMLCKMMKTVSKAGVRKWWWNRIIQQYWNWSWYWPQCRCRPVPPYPSSPLYHSWWAICSERSGGGLEPGENIELLQLETLIVVDIHLLDWCDHDDDNVDDHWSRVCQLWSLQLLSSDNEKAPGSEQPMMMRGWVTLSQMMLLILDQWWWGVNTLILSAPETLLYWSRNSAPSDNFKLKQNTAK